MDNMMRKSNRRSKTLSEWQKVIHAWQTNLPLSFSYFLPRELAVMSLYGFALLASGCGKEVDWRDLDKKENTLVMVRGAQPDPNDFYGLTEMIAEVEHHPVDPVDSVNQKSDYVLVNPPPLLLDEIAAKAHSHQTGLACGRLELLLDYPESSAQRLKPRYHGSIKLDSIASVVQNYQKNSGTLSKTLLESIVAEGTRFHRSTTGIAFPAKLLDLFKDTLSSLKRTDITYDLIEHPTHLTEQKSLIVRIPGLSKADELVILGAHLDSINSLNGAQSDQSKALGADDDASGLTTLLEVARLIAENKLQFERTIEFHAYAAEEIGLVGSVLIASDYFQEAKNVVGMLQIDMNGYSADPEDDHIYLVTNNTSANLRRSLKDLLNTYMAGGYTEEELVGGSSDHASWTKFDFPAVFPFEKPSAYNPNIHTPDDIVANINNFSLHKRFIQLGLLFASHYAGVTGEEDAYQAHLKTHFESFAQDLYLAMLPEDNKTLIHLATDISVEHVEICLNDAAASLNCASERLQGKLYRTTEERAFFSIETAMSLSDKDRLSIFGYNEKDHLVAYRSVQVQEKKELEP